MSQASLHKSQKTRRSIIHPAAALSATGLALHLVAMQVADVAGQNPRRLALLNDDERADEVARMWRHVAGRSIHTDDRSLVIRRDYRGRARSHQMEVAA